MTHDKTFPLLLNQVVTSQHGDTTQDTQQWKKNTPQLKEIALPYAKKNKTQKHLHSSITKPSASGLGLDSECARLALVTRLQTGGINNIDVLKAIAIIPRHLFVDSGLASQAYEDTALPIGYQQTISKPSIVAYMISCLKQGSHSSSQFNKVLEIGTGCGYQAAVLSQVAREVYSIERIKPLFEKAKKHLRPLRLANVRLHHGDGMLGLPQVAPFDAIILAAAGLTIPQTLLNQLTIGGKLIAPVVYGKEQILKMIERQSDMVFNETMLETVLFVPLKSGIA